MSNPFYTSEEHVDDEKFLNHSRTGSGGYMLSNQVQGSYSGGQSDGAAMAAVGRPSSQENHLHRLIDRKREIEQRTLDSSNRSLGMLSESEKTGAYTAEELHRQKEQLRKTEERLLDINSTLKTSERHLQGIKSVFGGIKNYFRGGPALVVANSQTVSRPGEHLGKANCVASNQSPDTNYKTSHPGLRVHGHDGNNPVRTSEAVNDALDRNLEEMSQGLTRLKGLAQNLNQELDEHNDIIERIDNEAAIAGLKINKQNKDMDKLLKKK